MGFDNQLFTFFRDDLNEGMSITIIGSSKAALIRNVIPLPCLSNDTSIQTERPIIRIDRDASTQDVYSERPRERYCDDGVRLEQENTRMERDANREGRRQRARGKYNRELDVRYLNMKSLRDILYSAYSCNQKQCRMIREKMQAQQQEIQGRRTSEASCSFHGSKIKNSVSIKAGPSFDEIIGSKTCANCPLANTSSSKVKSSRTRKTNITRSRYFNDNCVAPHSNTRPVIIIRNERKTYTDGRSLPRNNIARKKSNTRKYVDGFSTPSKINTTNKESFHVKTSKCSEKYVDATLNYINRNIGGNDSHERHVVDEKPLNYNQSSMTSKIDNSNNCEQYEISYNQSCDPKHTSRLVDDCTEPCVIIDNCKNLSSGCSDSDGYTTSNSNNIIAPRFSVSCDITANDCSGLSTDNQADTSGDNLTFIIKERDVSNGSDNVDLNLVNTPQKPGVNTTIDSYTKLATGTIDGQYSMSKFTNKLNQQYCKNTVESSTSYEITPPCGAESNNLNNNKSELSINSVISRKDSGTNPVFKEVKEWMREVPIYPGLSKQAKEDNKKTINNLINNLYSLGGEIGSKEFDEKVRNEIGTCLSKITIWCPGAQREQKGFKRNLVERLYQRIKNANKRNKISIGKQNRSAVTDVHESIMSCGQTFNSLHFLVDTEVRTCIMDWLKSIYPEMKLSDEIEYKIINLAKFVITRVNPILSEQVNKDENKIALKTTIIDFMEDCPIINPKVENMHFQRLAENLTDKLISIKANISDLSEFSQTTPSKKYCDKCLSPVDISYNPRELTICSEIKKCFEDACVDCNYSVIEEAGTILYDSFKIPNPEGKRRARNEIINLLVTSTNLSEDESCQLAKLILTKVRKAIDEGYVTNGSQTYAQFYIPNTISVFTSIEDTTKLNYPITSTPKRNREKREIPKLNEAEIKYTADVTELIRAWMDTLPKTFNAPDEQEFKETLIWDLASDITDGLKVEQLIGPREDRKELLKYIVCRWVIRLGEFEIKDVLKDIDIFLDTIVDLPVPILVQPQHGNRQDMAGVWFENRLDQKPFERFVQKGTDVLEDQISMWVNEQPSSIFTDNDKRNTQVKVRDLAQVLENNLGSKRPETEVFGDIAQWLNQIVRPEKRKDINELAENLKNRLIKLPQDATMVAELEERIKYEREKIRMKAELAKAPKIYESAEQENTMTIFISNFIERHYDVEDPLARRAFNRLLNSELIRLSNPTRKEIFEKFEQGKHDNLFPSRNMVKELEYIKYISDWLKNLPVDATYHTVGNRERSDFINSLAESIRQIEADREREPNAIDYNVYLYIMIEEHIKLLPMTKPQQAESIFLVQQLYEKIVALREIVAEIVEVNESMNTTGVNADNIGDLIEEFIKVNGGDIAHDEVKMEAWAIRLIREIKKLVQGTSQPSVLLKAQVYEKLADIPVPSDETAKYFNIEFDYVIEITNWMKNLPFLPLNEPEKDYVINKICQLSDEMVDTDKKIDTNPSDREKIENDLRAYIDNWISELPLDKKQNIVKPVLINQLLNRIDKLKRNDVESELIISSSKPKKSRTFFNKSKKNKNVSSGDLVNAIEKWSNALPIKTENADDTLNIKNGISARLLHKVGQLNMNPTAYNDDILYEDSLRDEIDANFDKLPQNSDLQSKKERLKTDLVNMIIEMKNEIKDKTAGDAYKIKLEKTIDSSIPNPVPCYQVYDPGFEIYKDRLATMFILENFDHGTDAVKLKHEQLLKKEIDKYFEHAKYRNAAPFNKDQLYTELYSHLFRVPIPNKASVVDEVEKLKTRCEIDAWFEELPLREAYDLNELLEWDKQLSSLATHIHEIETSESKPDNKILKEIMKWLLRLPFQPRNDNKIEEYADALQKKLKSTANQRKCIPESPKKGKKDKAKAHKESKETFGLSQAQNLSENRKPRRKNAADEICDIVQTWCNSLPMNNENNQNIQTMRDNLTTKIMFIISELNRNPEIFNNDVIYDKVLGDEIERLLSSIFSCGECPNKAAKINQLKVAIKSVKFLIDEENATYQFKQDLNNIVEKFLEKPKNISCQGKEALLETVKNDIIDDFIQYKYSNDNDEDKQYRKINIEDNISTYTIVAKGKKKEADNQNGPKNGNLMKTNQLITELAKVSPQTDKIVTDEVEEIRMKKQIEVFFEEMHIPGRKDDTIKVKNLKDILAKKLNNIELHGYTPENENKMKKEIERCLNKLGKDKNQSLIDAFVTRLKNNETLRRMPQNEGKVGPDSLENCCKGVCNKNNATGVPANFIKNAFNAKSGDRIFDSESTGRGRKTCPDNESEEEINSGEEDGTTDDSKTLCLCKKKSSGKKKKPYCMVPVRYLYGCDGYDSLWCRMPFPGFF